MADNKKYYYLKLKENFYESEEMIILQNMKDGYLYSDILMKLYLRSLKNEGKLMFKDVIPYTPEVLSQVVRHQVGTVKMAMDIFKSLGLIEILDNGAIYMLDIQNFIGESSTEADRQRQYYNKIKAEKSPELPSGKKPCKKSYKKSTPEIEIDKELELKKKKELELKEFQNEFEKLWALYPNKQGKAKALASYIKARKNAVPYEEIERGVKTYAEYVKGKDRQYIKHGSTWFNQECWNDELNAPKNDPTSFDVDDFFDHALKRSYGETRNEEIH